MALYWNVVDSTNEDFNLSFGAGFVAEVADQIMSPERAEAERAQIERENREFEEAQADAKRDAEALEKFWSARYGTSPYKKPSDVLARGRPQRRPRRPCRGTAPGLDERGRPRRQPYKSDLQRRREAHATLDKIHAEPATKGDLKKVAVKADVGNLRLQQKLDRLFGRKK